LILALLVYLAGILAFSAALVVPVILFHRWRARLEKQQRGFEVKTSPRRANRPTHPNGHIDR
jgi:hypothetical protein